MPLPLPAGEDHTGYQEVDQIEADMSKYSLGENNIGFHDSPVSPSSQTGSSPEDPQLDSRHFSTVAQPISNGLIHGHVHNFDNFTYIHGHIHTNDSLFDPLAYSHTEQTPSEDPQQRALRRRNSHHRHLNDLHSSQFTDCQHFEFLNCHDQQSKPMIVEDPDITCEEDENCKPKILEICCDNTHAQDDSFVPLFPDVAGLTKNQHQHPHAHAHDHGNLFAHPNDDKTFEDCNFDDCIDVKCDLDTCDIDELYCKYCENLDDFPDIKASIQSGNSSGNTPSQIHAHCQSHCESHDHDHGLQEHSHSLSKSSLKQLVGSSIPQIQGAKREREEDDSGKPPNVLHHHLHHHAQHTHPENHHHHHIQLHDHHHDKKIKSEFSDPSNSLINFEWNFKNQQAKCEWDSCSSMFDNTLLLQTHIVENHLVPEFNIQNVISDGPGPDDSQLFECEWKNCDYTGEGIPALLSHINSQHSGYPADGKLSVPQSKNLLTPSPDHTHGDVYVGGDDEETTCKWIIANEDGSTHVCGQEFANSENLTNHLVENHVGSGQGMYFCMWENCDRQGTGFKQRQKALRHLHTHTHYKPLKCDVCGRRFAVDTMLKQHMRTHSGEKPYKCTMCDKRFATSSSLSVHLRTHTGEKPLVCKYPGCGKRFSESSNLTKHMRIHEKEYKCGTCLRSFATAKQLNSHNAKYHPDSERYGGIEKPQVASGSIRL